MRLRRALLGIELGGNVDALLSPGPLLIVANHPGRFDPVLLSAVVPPHAIVIVSPLAARAFGCRLLKRARGEAREKIGDRRRTSTVR